MSELHELLGRVRACTICAEHLPLGPNPVLSVRPEARILLIGQAPGIRVHESGIPWNDPSGVQLRKWLEVEPDQFYNDPRIAIMPMGFCYPGTGKQGDLPPRPECAAHWHRRVLDQLPRLELTVLIGQYAQKHYLGKGFQNNLTETVRRYEEFLPDFLPLPHPSPRNRLWMKKNPWFEENVVPVLRTAVKELLP